MKYLKQFGIIITLSFLGEILHEVIPLPVPASIYGIVILFICLETGHIKVQSVKETSQFLIGIMPVMFIPAAVGLIDSWEIMKNQLLVYLLIAILTTFVVMIAAGKVTQCIIRKSGKGEAANE